MDRLDEIEHEPVGDVEGLDQHGLAGLEAGRVADDDFGESGVAWIAHGNFRGWDARGRPWPPWTIVLEPPRKEETIAQRSTSERSAAVAISSNPSPAGFGPCSEESGILRSAARWAPRREGGSE